MIIALQQDNTLENVWEEFNGEEILNANDMFIYGTENNLSCGELSNITESIKKFLACADYEYSGEDYIICKNDNNIDYLYFYFNKYFRKYNFNAQGKNLNNLLDYFLAYDSSSHRDVKMLNLTKIISLITNKNYTFKKLNDFNGFVGYLYYPVEYEKNENEMWAVEYVASLYLNEGTIYELSEISNKLKNKDVNEIVNYLNKNVNNESCYIPIYQNIKTYLSKYFNEKEENIKVINIKSQKTIIVNEYEME